MAEQTQKSEELLIQKKDTWGSFGQHSNIYTFAFKPEEGAIVSIWELVKSMGLTVRSEIRDSRKNLHRYHYLPPSELAKLEGYVLIRVSDYQSSARRVIERSFFLVRGGALTEVPVIEKGLRDASGFYDVIEVEGKRYKVYKDKAVPL